MADIPFLLSYWRPWEEGSSLTSSWGDYLRDSSLAEYTTRTIGAYISRASLENVEAIERASQRQVAVTQRAAIAQVAAIKRASEIVGLQINKVQEEIKGVNRRLDLALEQQRAGIILQQDIAELLKIPDFEKERIHAINLGVEYFNRAMKQPELLQDALDEFLHAESLKKQDCFVLHRIGCIYLYGNNFIDLDKAKDYFLRAAKYATSESEEEAKALVSKLISSSDSEYTKVISDKSAVGLLAADSYDKAALTDYILGNDESAILIQQKAIEYDDSPKNHINLAKYLIRRGDKKEGVSELRKAIKQDPTMIGAALTDLDIASEPLTQSLIEELNAEVDDELEQILFKSFSTEYDPSSVIDTLVLKQVDIIGNLPQKATYIDRSNILKEYYSIISPSTNRLFNQCDQLIRLIDKEPVYSFTKDQREKIHIILSPKEAPSIDDLQRGFDKVTSLLDTHVAKIGDHVPGGRILFIDKDDNGWYGLMCTERPIGKAEWCDSKYCSNYHDKDATDFGTSESDGESNTRTMYSHNSDAARMCKSCREGNHDDWYLPSIKELLALFNAVKLDREAFRISDQERRVFMNKHDVSSIPVSFKYLTFWSSTEGFTTPDFEPEMNLILGRKSQADNGDYALAIQLLSNGSYKQVCDKKYYENHVWPVRRFRSSFLR